MLRALETTTGQTVWVNDSNVSHVYGDENTVKIRTLAFEVLPWVFKGTADGVVDILNGREGWI